jgi:hypothetical protein
VSCESFGFNEWILTSLLRMLAFLAIKNNAWSTRSLWSYRLSPGDTPTSIGRIFFFPFLTISSSKEKWRLLNVLDCKFCNKPVRMLSTPHTGELNSWQHSSQENKNINSRIRSAFFPLLSPLSHLRFSINLKPVLHKQRIKFPIVHVDISRSGSACCT